jgi:Domain of unknown function (DUF1707)
MNTEQLRVGDAERDEVTTALHEHFAQGRLTRDELDERLTATLSARTVGDLRAVTRDLPGPPAHGAVARGPVDAAPWGRGPFAPRGGRGPAWTGTGRWGPPRGRPFGPLLLLALIVAAVTGGWWIVLPVLAFLWLTAAFAGLRHARRRHSPISLRR